MCGTNAATASGECCLGWCLEGGGGCLGSDAVLVLLLGSSCSTGQPLAKARHSTQALCATTVLSYPVRHTLLAIGLAGQLQLRTASVEALPFDAGAFDAAIATLVGECACAAAVATAACAGLWGGHAACRGAGAVRGQRVRGDGHCLARSMPEL